PEIISYCVWLYYRFPLSYRDIEEIMAERGIMLTYETVRKWCLKFAQRYAKELRHRRSHPADKWHLDEVFVTIKSQVYYVWRTMRRFHSPGQTHRFLSTFGPISSHFRPRRHTLRAVNYRQEMKQRFVIWEEVTGLPSVASPDEQTRRKCLPSSPSRLLSQ